MYLTMQLAQDKAISLSCSTGVTVFSTLFQYSSLLVGSDPLVLLIRVILQSSKKPL